jgi:capping protein beta
LVINSEIDNSDPNLPFLKTEFNRDGDSYRSPHSNIYHPPTQGGYTPQGTFRQLEELGNILFSEYIKLYYGGNAVGSFYVIEGENANKFSCGYFVKKCKIS